MTPSDVYAHLIVFTLVGCAFSICITGSFVPTIGAVLALLVLGVLTGKLEKR